MITAAPRQRLRGFAPHPPPVSIDPWFTMLGWGSRCWPHRTLRFALGQER